MNKSYLLIILFLCGLSAGNVFAADASAAAAARAYGARSATADTLKLIEAARVNNVTDLRQLLESKPDVNAKNHYEETPLMRAAIHGNDEALLLLKEAGADVNAADSHGYTALMYAALYGHLKTVKLLLSWNADKNIKTTNDSSRTRTAESIARDKGYEQIADFIHEYNG